ncbi:unnamed protein product [Calicophoron daubneyi]|uniref:Uncharacterized protein n=1 Tax=Calicophoron daubneyi TaxID=300641 RepID=A0AAV2TU77_CALDB
MEDILKVVIGTSQASGMTSKARPYLRTRGESATDYLEVLKPKKGADRMEVCPYIPKTLTRKGYAHIKDLKKRRHYERLVFDIRKKGILFEDPEFPATDQSIGEVKEIKGEIEWKRPKEINPNARFLDHTASRFDIEQGSLGDCWLLSVLSSISVYPALFHYVVPPGQTFNGPKYIGMFHLRYWRFGEWVDVIIDDRLPVYKGTNNLVFMHSPGEDVFWSALAEKAYAKLHGCYAHLDGGSQTDAMEDVTGGIAEVILLTPDKRPDDLLERMIVYANRCCLMGCYIESENGVESLANGLYVGHAYSVTGFQSVKYRGQKVYLVRCRNPWGASFEWNGPWSDGAQEWNEITEEDKTILEVQFRNDGEFWMSFDDFVSNFTRMCVCHLGLESLTSDDQLSGKRRLQESILYGSWERNITAGGCLNNRATYHTNPQFRFTVSTPDPGNPHEKSLVIIGLMQRDVRAQRGDDFLTIGFTLYQVKETQNSLLSRAYLLSKAPMGKSSFSRAREVFARFELDPGTYVIIPSTYHPQEEGKFIIRLFCLVAVNDCELDEENSKDDIILNSFSDSMGPGLVDEEDKGLKEKFERLSDSKTKVIDWRRLATILNESSLKDIPGGHEFGKEFCRSLVASVDHNLTGFITWPEFEDLWPKLKGWKTVFQKYDPGHSGFVKSYELRQAIRSSGYTISNKVFSALVHRYQDLRAPGFNLEDFMLCLVRLKNLFETIIAQPENEDGDRLFSEEDYIRLSLSL